MNFLPTKFVMIRKHCGQPLREQVLHPRSGLSWNEPAIEPFSVAAARRSQLWKAGAIRAASLLLGLVAASVLCASALAGDEASDSNTSEQTDAGHAEFWQEELKPFLETYCMDCHSGDGAEASIDFASYTDEVDFSSERPRWNQVRGLVDIGVMPPPDYGPLPSREERDEIASAIDRVVNTVDCDIVHDPGRVTMRRLNSVEYDNSVRDLLGVDFSVSGLIEFPSDSVGNGFDNQGDVLTLSPLQLEKYLRAARLVTSEIIVHDRDEYRRQRDDYPALYPGDSADVKFLFADGEYRIRARLWFEEGGDEKMPVVLKLDGETIAEWEVDGDRETFELNHDLTAGERTLSLQFVEDPGSDKKEYKRRIETDYIEVRGPEEGDPPLPASHRNLFVSYPSDDKSDAEAAREIFEPLLRRAFRREPEQIELDRVVNLVTMAREQEESFEQAVAYGVQSILVSPKFLFRIEDQSQTAEDGTELLGDYQLATRLSYFLWASLPDEELLDAARDGQLSEPEQLRKQVKRMLADPKSDALVNRFFGQFLGLGSLKEIEPDPDQFPLWNDRMREAVVRETQLFCREIVREDLPLRALLQGDFTYVNPRLAELYDMQFDGRDPAELYEEGPGLRRGRSGSSRDKEYRDEERWIRVELPENRQGVLTHASILTLTSNPTETSPVKRGKWVLESILGDPPPPAPPNVPSFEEAKEGNEDLTLRQQLEIHRENPSCASCHKVMDPIGLGFEHFNAIGQYREKDGEHPIDAAGELADGRKFNGSAELVALLAEDQRSVYRHFAEKLLTYALGRGLEPYDNCAVDEIMTYAEERGFRLSSFIEAIVVSDPFCKRRGLQLAFAENSNPEEG